MKWITMAWPSSPIQTSSQILTSNKATSAFCKTVSPAHHRADDFRKCFYVGYDHGTTTMMTPFKLHCLFLQSSQSTLCFVSQQNTFPFFAMSLSETSRSTSSLRRGFRCFFLPKLSRYQL